MSVVLRIRRGSTTQWASSTKVLLVGELGIDTTLNKIKAGNGLSLWADLPWLHATPNDISTMLTAANEYTDEAVSGIGNSLSGTYVLVADVGNEDGVAPLDANALIPDQYIPSTIARDSELFSGSYSDLTNKPTLFSGSYNDLSNKPDLTVYAPKASPTLTGTTSVDNLEISGALTFNGTATQINQTDLTISDPLIYLADGNAANINDLGFVVAFNDGTYQHAGLVRDSSENTWKLFKGVIDEPTNTINFSQGSLDSLSVSTLVGNVTGNVTGNISGNAGTVTNGVYTNGSYSDPSWLTISKSKVGLSNVDNTSDSNKPVSTATQTALDSKSDKTTTITTQSSGYTLSTTDLGKLIEMSGGGTLTISDSSSFPVGFSCDILQTGSSQVTIAGSGFTPNGTPGLKLRAQWSSATLLKRSLNSWVVMGDLSA
jgi:hypothetical protein